jgi:hypothetical protein
MGRLVGHSSRLGRWATRSWTHQAVLYAIVGTLLMLPARYFGLIGETGRQLAVAPAAVVLGASATLAGCGLRLASAHAHCRRRRSRLGMGGFGRPLPRRPVIEEIP